MIGFMGTTAFLSMWISNTASTAMMLPIANAVLKQLSDTEANADDAVDGFSPAMGGLENQAFEIEESKQSNGKVPKIKENGISFGESFIFIFLHLPYFKLYIQTGEGR